MRSTGTRKSAGSRAGYRIAAAVLALTLAVACGSCREKLDSLGIHLSIEKYTLANGLQVVLVEDHTVPVVSYQTWYRVGSVDEKPGLTGISHMFEHLMFKGTPKYGPKEFFQQLEAKGAEVNAFTTRDYTVYYENFTPDLLEKAIDMESDRMTNLKLEDEIFQTERQVVFEERRLRTDNNPAGRMQEALWELAYQRHPYGWPVIGYPQDLLRMTTDDLVSYYKSHYQPANAFIVAVGDIQPSKTIELIRKYYGKIPQLPRPKRDVPPEPEQDEERRLNIYDQVASERFAQAYHVTAADDDDSYALDVLANILFEGTTSRAYRRLIDEKDMAIGISGSAFTPTYPGLFIVTGTMKGNIPASRAEKELDQVYAELVEKGVTAEEVEIAVRQLMVQLVDSVRTPYGMGQLLGTVQTIFGTTDKFADNFNRYLKVRPEDVKRVAQKYLVPNNRSVIELLPESKRPGKKKGSE